MTFLIETDEYIHWYTYKKKYLLVHVLNVVKKKDISYSRFKLFINKQNNYRISIEFNGKTVHL